MVVLEHREQAIQRILELRGVRARKEAAWAVNEARQQEYHNAEEVGSGNNEMLVMESFMESSHSVRWWQAMRCDV